MVDALSKTAVLLKASQWCADHEGPADAQMRSDTPPPVADTTCVKLEALARLALGGGDGAAAAASLLTAAAAAMRSDDLGQYKRQQQGSPSEPTSDSASLSSASHSPWRGGSSPARKGEAGGGGSGSGGGGLGGLLDSLAVLASQELMTIRAGSDFSDATSAATARASDDDCAAAAAAPPPLPRMRPRRPRSQSNPEGMEKSAGWTLCRRRRNGGVSTPSLTAARRSLALDTPMPQSIKEECEDAASRLGGGSSGGGSGSDGGSGSSAAAAALTLPHLLHKYADVYNRSGRIGIYTLQEREAIIARYRAKRARRVWRKKIRYNCRKNLADKRLRVKGRFVKMTPAQRAALQLQISAGDGGGSGGGGDDMEMEEDASAAVAAAAAAAGGASRRRGTAAAAAARRRGRSASVNERDSADEEEDDDDDDEEEGRGDEPAEPLKRTRRHSIAY
ncbi:hypothetical protein JKP88DRAFT_312402 [Tribonema minus]|uniref:CCT domain-containing protein n=1 Tax=Tribonema minus TaxID=303371 RepID=A0A835Z588_9STRA|nr:hypothetical protein JKP88DRAFT_312402 [Tribonema minus]